jgi:hypothetical protein
MNRREMLAVMGLLAAGGSVSGAPMSTTIEGDASSPMFDVRKFGATGDGKTLDTASINRAVDAAHAAGGGMAYLPPGIYLSGTVVLKSNVTLYLEAGATLLGSKSISDYAPQLQTAAAKTESGTATFVNDLRDASSYHLIFARDAENVGLAGLGRIDGQGSAYWVPSGRTLRPPEDSWLDVIAYNWKPAPPRPSPMLEFYNCKNLHIRDLRIENSAGWTLRPIHCDNVFIRGVSIKNPVYGPNTDGIDPTCCHNVFISDCLIDTGDDAICLKSENPYGEELRASKNITITNCVLSGCCNGLKLGTATHGAFENIVFSNSVIFNDDVPLNERIIAGIALEIVDGGAIDGVVISNIKMQRVRTPIFIRRGNRKPRSDGSPGTLRGVMIENVHATGAILTSSITGLPGFDVEDVTLCNLRIDSEEGGQAKWVDRDVPENPKMYPESRMFGRLPSYGFYCRHVTGLRMRNVEFKSVAAEARPVVVCDDVKDLEVEGLRSLPTAETQPVIKLVQTRNALLRGCLAPAGTKSFLQVQGDATEKITLMGSQLGEADQAVQSGPEVPMDAVTLSGNVAKA